MNRIDFGACQYMMLQV